MSQTTVKSSRTSIFGLIAIIIILIAALGFYYFQASANLTSDSSTISSQSSQLSAQAGQITADQARIVVLNSNISSLEQTVASLRSTVFADQAKITAETSAYAKANSTIATLNEQITTLNGQISSLNSQISTYQTQVSSLQVQIASLTSITGLKLSTQLVAARPYNTGPAGYASVVNFTAHYAGYVLVTVSAASDFSHEGPQVRNSFTSNIQGNYLGTTLPGSGLFFTFMSDTDSIAIPVLPGAVSVYVFTSDSSPQTATLSVNYYY